jgi:hypothetical protein
MTFREWRERQYGEIVLVDTTVRDDELGYVDRFTFYTEDGRRAAYALPGVRAA